MTGYTRQSSSDIIEGLPITATPIAREFNRLADAMGVSGHTHDGSVGNGPKISLASAVAGVLKVANGGIGGVHRLDATTDPLTTDDTVAGYAPGSLWVNLTGPRLFVCTSNTSGAAKWRYIALVDDQGKILPKATGINAIGSATKRFTDLYITDIDAQSIYVTGTTESAGGFIGGVTGDVVGNVSGNVTGDVTGNVTAAAGTTTLFNLVVNNTVDFTNTRLQNVAAPAAGSDAATKLYVDQALDALISAAPGTMDTLNELAAALGDDPNFAQTVNASIAEKLSKAGGTMTGAITMGGNKVTGLPTPTLVSDAVTLQYVSDLYGSTASAATSAALAEDWATKPENTVVTSGKYSAKHHATKASASATAADASKVAAADSATQASNSASAASTSETNASDSETAAAASESAAAATLVDFESRYLGPKGSDPTVDNNGVALTAGALYYNTASKVIRAYNGSVWSDYSYDETTVAITGGSIDVPSLKVSNNDVWHSGNDGSGSGLDADKLDGLHSSYFQKNIGDVHSIEINNTGVGDRSAYVDFHSSDHSSQDDYSSRVIREAGIDGDLEFINKGVGGINFLSDGGQNKMTYNGQKLWHEGNDGAGSGLDADTLDGLQNTAFVRNANGDQTIAGAVTAYSILVPYRPDIVSGPHTYVDGITYFEGGTADGLPSDLNTALTVKDSAFRHFQLSASKDSTDLHWRSATSDTLFGPWQELWHTGNVGPGSGLDADTVDGLEASQLMRTDATNTVDGSLFITNSSPQVTLTESDTGGRGRMVHSGGILYLQSGSSGTTDTGEIRFTGYNGTDVTDFLVRTGGVYHSIWHAGNDGYSSSLIAGDSGKLSGAVMDQVGNAFTIVQRNSWGDVNARLMRSTYPNGSIANTAAVIMRNNDGTDNYHRPVSPSTFTTWLGNQSFIRFQNDIYVRAGINLENPGNAYLTGNIRVLDGANLRITADDGEVQVMDKFGNGTIVSPHFAEALPNQSYEEDMGWGYYSERDGKYITVDMTKVIRLVEELSGEVLIHEGMVEHIPKSPEEITYDENGKPTERTVRNVYSKKKSKSKADLEKKSVTKKSTDLEAQLATAMSLISDLQADIAELKKSKA